MVLYILLSFSKLGENIARWCFFEISIDWLSPGYDYALLLLDGKRIEFILEFSL